MLEPPIWELGKHSPVLRKDIEDPLTASVVQGKMRFIVPPSRRARFFDRMRFGIQHAFFFS